MQLPGSGGTKGSQGKNAAHASCFQIPWTEVQRRKSEHILLASGVSNYFPHIHTQLPFWRPTFCLAAPSLLAEEPAVNRDEVWTVGLNIVPLWCLVVENTLILRIKEWVRMGRQNHDGILERLDSKTSCWLTLASGVWSSFRGFLTPQAQCHLSVIPSSASPAWCCSL